MKNVYEVLRSKELEIEKLQTEIQALRIAAPLLSDDADSGNGNVQVSSRWSPPARPVQVPKAANADPQPEHATDWKEKTAGFP